MNQLTLINGRYSKAEAERLVNDLIKTKTTFHQARIKTVHESEEEIKHSEKRIKELEKSLRHALAEIKDAPGSTVDIEADIRVYS